MSKFNEQDFYYDSISGLMLGNKARKELITNELELIPQGTSFLEVGCAQGLFVKTAKRKAEIAVGVDYEEDKLEFASKASLNCDFIQGDGEKLPFKDKAFDIVLCTEVIEHIPNWKKAVKEISRVAKKKVIITIPLEKAVFWRFFSIFMPMHTRKHLHRLDSKDIIKNMKDWKLTKKENITTPSRRLNKRVNGLANEKTAIYVFLVFEKGKRK